MEQLLCLRGAGLGIEVDESALERYRVEPDAPTPQDLFQTQRRICRVHIPNEDGGETLYDFTGESVYSPAFSEGKYLGFVHGVWLEVIEDNHTDGFNADYERADNRELQQ